MGTAGEAEMPTPTSQERQSKAEQTHLARAGLSFVEETREERSRGSLAQEVREMRGRRAHQLAAAEAEARIAERARVSRLEGLADRILGAKAEEAPEDVQERHAPEPEQPFLETHTKDIWEVL